MAVMAWFKKERKPRISQRTKLEIPKDAWERCESCGHVDIRERFERALNVCSECGHHRRFTAEEYIELFSDAGTWREFFAGLRSQDPLSFENYGDRLVAAEKKAGGSDAIFTWFGRLEGLPIHLGVMNVAFMGGSMGSVVGEKIARLARRSADKKLPLVLVCTSGGARMQEGVLSLMQMAKTSAAIAQLKMDSIPLVTVLTNPTTGGVSASFAMQGRHPGRAGRGDWICGPAGDQADHRTGSPRRIPDRRVSPRSWPDRRRGASRIAPRNHRAADPPHAGGRGRRRRHGGRNRLNCVNSQRSTANGTNPSKHRLSITRFFPLTVDR